MFTCICRHFGTIALVLGLSALVATAAELPNLTGTWVLNEKLSDRLGPPQGAGGGRPSGGKGGGARPGKVGGTRGDLGHEPSSEEMQKTNRLRQEHALLEVFHDGIELDVTNGLDVSRLIFTDGRTMTIWTPEGMAQATATWEEQTLVVQWKTEEEAMSRVRRYMLSVDGERLTVKEKRRLPDDDEYREITLNYDKKIPPKGE